MIEQAQILSKYFPIIDAVNVPERPSYELRSLDGCRIVANYFQKTFVHVRTIDVSIDQIPELVATLQKYSISNVLVLQGDMPCNEKSTSFTKTEHFIHALHTSDKNLQIYATLNPYRSTFKEEVERAKARRMAGASGFFTQPFFDEHTFYQYVHAFSHTKVYWGITPVLSKESMHYWQKQNHVQFPPNFLPNLDWNITYAKKILSFIQKEGGDVYLMPVHMDAFTYCQYLFGLAKSSK